MRRKLIPGQRAAVLRANPEQGKPGEYEGIMKFIATLNQSALLTNIDITCTYNTFRYSATGEAEPGSNATASPVHG